MALAPSPSDGAAGLAPGQQFAGVRIERLIARGAHGAVYAVTDLAAGDGPQALRALKLLTPPSRGAEAAEAAEAAERLAREADTLQRLVHPCIVRVHRAGRTLGRPWLLMELLAGTDLARYTRPARLLPEPVVVRIGERLARALAFAHARGVVHRDLKPANVVVDWAADRVVLTDFGLAAVAGAERTRTGLVLGSPAYMAPELLAGAPADAQTDLYALGVLLYQLLTGELPFDAPALGELMRRIAADPAPDPAARRPGVPAPLAALVRALLAKSPAQ
ncbi:MAG: serine/threonine protein kinase, partial [Burkholderiales bacterium]|nr:serine/threonine protein kinase [Burkholderiales bacterium]